MIERAYFNHIVLQPTTLCNLDCGYCYLPDRLNKQKMPIAVAEAVAKSIETVDHPISIVWHGGEPLATGIEHFRKLLEPFGGLSKTGKISHSIQTNATLLTDEWCHLIKEEKIRIGVSIDGTESQTSARKNWSGKSVFGDIMDGIRVLKRNSINFSVISVVNSNNFDDPAGFYRFFVEEIGCNTLNVNVEESEGLNVRNVLVDEEKVKKFWLGLWSAWRQNPRIKIREFNLALGWLVYRSVESEADKYVRNFWPTVSTDGDVVVLSPEFHALPLAERKKFVVGNVLDRSLVEIIDSSLASWYVRDFDKGLHKCKEACVYFDFCRGGQASNKYFELRDISGTETAQCRNTRQYVLDTVMEVLKNEKKGGEVNVI